MSLAAKLAQSSPLRKGNQTGNANSKYDRKKLDNIIMLKIFKNKLYLTKTTSGKLLIKTF